MDRSKKVLAAFVLLGAWLAVPSLAQFGFHAADPGPRTGPAGAGGPLAGLDPAILPFFLSGFQNFIEVESVTGSIAGTGAGLGPRFNLDSCAGCHAQPTLGGSSPALNPEIAVATRLGATNQVPFFIQADGPIREARFVLNPDGSPDGMVHELFTIAGRSDAPGCTLAQPDFEEQAREHNLAFRIPTPLFGAGLVENIPDSAILANQHADAERKAELGIHGHPNRSANDGTITRFGWKAQNKSILLFCGEAYNVEMGVANELFPQERDETEGCVLNPTPEDITNFSVAAPTGVPSDIEQFAFFVRFLAPPEPAASTPETLRGRRVFDQVGCSLCHTPSLDTGATSVQALSRQSAALYSDLLVHHMGQALADRITQGSAGPDEFRTAPLWGVGQRIFFLHDGRARDVLAAILAHQSSGSEAGRVVVNFNALSEQDKQAVLDFLRSL